MRGSREILKGSESRVLAAIEGINTDVSELLLLSEKILTSAKSMEKEASTVQEQVRSQVESGRRKAKLAVSSKREEIAREALRHSVALELESERSAAESTRLKTLITELERWNQDLKKMQEDLATMAKLWKEKRGRSVVYPSASLLGRIIKRMIRASSVIDKVDETIDVLKVDIEGLERLRLEPEPSAEAFGWNYKMPADLKAKLDAKLQEELTKIRAAH